MSRPETLPPETLPREVPSPRKWAVAAAAALSLFAGSAFAAPFCVAIPGGQPACFYTDAGVCNVRAAQIHQQCVINPQEIQVLPGGEPYCAIDSHRMAQCFYTTILSCQERTNPATSFCFANPAASTASKKP